jgi:hypothetical protein
MRELLNQLLKDQDGMILSSEVVLVGTILVLGSIVGLVAVSTAVTHELNDVANAYHAQNGYNGAYQNNGNPYSRNNDYQYTIGDSTGTPEVAGY